MAFSAIPAAKAGLLTLLGARAGLSGVQVEWGLPADEQSNRERIFVGKAETDREWATLGQMKLEEVFEIELTFEHWAEGDDRRACEERAWALVEEAEQAIKSDPRLGGSVRVAYLSRALQDLGPFEGQGWLTKIDARVRCTARIG